VGKNIIASLCSRNRSAHYQLFVPAGLDYEGTVPSDVHCEFVAYRARGLARRWWHDEFALQRHIRRFAPEVVLCLGNLALSRSSAPQVLLVHDSHLFYPESHFGELGAAERWAFRYRRRRLSRDMQRAACVLCQTDVARTRIINAYGYRGNLIVLRNGPSPHIAAASRFARPIAVGPAGTLKLLCLARYYPHKNLELLVELFRRYRNRLQGVVVYLTIASSDHPRAQRLLNDIECLGLSTCIVNLGPVAPEALVQLYQAADAALLPSRLESSSSVYPEAMALDRPIITSDLDFAHAICGNAASYFNPNSAESLLTAVIELRDVPQRRAELIDRGRRVLTAMRASWDTNGATLNAVLEQVLTQNRGAAPAAPVAAAHRSLPR
jgi:glycosyltransferase involved in cell wall biosynthesis